LLLGLAVLAVLGAGLEKMILAIGMVLAPSFARVVHAATLSLKRREVRWAARCLGGWSWSHRGATSCQSVWAETVVLASC